jgi:phosphoribulokinase
MFKANKPVLIGLVGDSGVGKTTLSKGIIDIIGKENIAVICTDDYHMHTREERKENGVCPLDPAGNYMDIMEEHTSLLKEGKSILKPIYNHNTGQLDRPVYIEPKPFILLEGLLGYSTKRMRDCYDIKVFIEPEENLRLAWKIHRDMTKRGYTKQQVLDDLKKREPYSKNFIQPQRIHADIITALYGYDDSKEVDNQSLGMRSIIRPTLPHHNLNATINKLGDGVAFDLVRDMDNKPVDQFEVNEELKEGCFDKIVETLWSGIDADIEDIKERAKNHVANRTGFGLPTAITHIMLVSQMLKAATGSENT